MRHKAFGNSPKTACPINAGSEGSATLKRTFVTGRSADPTAQVLPTAY